MSINTDINKYKKQLILKAKKNGLYENFAQNEVRKLEDKYSEFRYKGNDEIFNKIQEFNHWCMNFDDNQLNKE